MQDIIKKYTESPEILNIYLHGSRVYKTNTDSSDYDFIIVIEDEYYFSENVSEGNCDFNFYSKTKWIEMCNNNSLDFCECYFLPEEYKIKETFVPDFIIQKEKIRANFSHISSNSFVKAKKKLVVEKDFAPYIGKKSLWHSFRILMFGIQILSSEKIVDYSCANFLYDEIIKNPENEWNYYKEKYQALYNHYRSEFRKFDQA